MNWTWGNISTSCKYLQINPALRRWIGLARRKKMVGKDWNQYSHAHKWNDVKINTAWNASGDNNGGTANKINGIADFHCSCVGCRSRAWICDDSLANGLSQCRKVARYREQWCATELRQITIAMGAARLRTPVVAQSGHDPTTHAYWIKDSWSPLRSQPRVHCIDGRNIQWDCPWGALAWITETSEFTV